MQVYVHNKGFILVGKAREIKQKILEYMRHYETVKALIDATSQKPNQD